MPIYGLMSVPLGGATPWPLGARFDDAIELNDEAPYSEAPIFFGAIAPMCDATLAPRVKGKVDPHRVYYYTIREIRDV